MHDQNRPIALPLSVLTAALAAIAQAPNAAAFAPFTAACADAFAVEGLDAAGNPAPEPVAADPSDDPNRNASALAELDRLTADDGGNADPQPPDASGTRDALAGWGGPESGSEYAAAAEDEGERGDGFTPGGTVADEPPDPL